METINLKQGESHLIRLHGLGSAGYQWILESSDPRIVAVEQILHSRQHFAGPIVGSLDQEFRLTATAPGESLVRFAQRRLFEQGREPHASYEVNVVVTG